MERSNRTVNSLETILTFENANANDWSVIWSTTHIPGMDTATGGPRRRLAGRRRLRVGAYTLAAFLTMHCRIAASALTGGFFVFMLFLVIAVALLANPLRHFEVYLGQWSLSGPGRAFRMIPMLDGIGIAICINALVRAIICCTIAAIAAVYVAHSVSDAELPFKYCRDFDLTPYDPIIKDVKSLMSLQSRFALASGSLYSDDEDEYHTTRFGPNYLAWRNTTYSRRPRGMALQASGSTSIQVCKETYPGNYPAVYSTPAYNYFYVEVVQYRSEYSFGDFNMPLVMSITLTWFVIWMFMLYERIAHGRLIWNNMHSWFVMVPWAWALVLLIMACMHLTSIRKSFQKVFRVGAKEILAGMSDALEVALYIHSAGTGTELIHGKGLNHYASGHIDAQLNGENVWHSGLVLLLTALHTGGAAVCALVDSAQPDIKIYNMHESTLWIIPMYSKCALVGNYSHLMSVLIFGGLVFSYMTVAFVLLKTALHTIFEYRVKLVFVEQAVVGSLILSCMGLSLIFATSYLGVWFPGMKSTIFGLYQAFGVNSEEGGLPLLESMDAVSSGMSVTLVCLLELVALLYVYRSHDFISDMNVATEENACATRIGTQWQIIPVIVIVTLVLKIITLLKAEMPRQTMLLSAAPLAGAAAAVPLRACHNAYVFLRPRPRRGT